MAMLHHRADAPRTVGVVGLGVGTLAAYAKPGDHWRFYEINPLVVDLARRDFTFLADAAAPIVVVLGDGRLSLAREPRWRFDLLVLDAFAGDSIPVHLLTREAFALYLEHLAPDGLIAVHASNRNVDMAPVVADAAEVFHLAARRAESYDAISNAEYCLRATWILVARDAASFDLPPFAALPPVAPRAGFSGWTDDRSSVLSLLE
jgi:spermidine synthase